MIVSGDGYLRYVNLSFYVEGVILKVMEQTIQYGELYVISFSSKIN